MFLNRQNLTMEMLKFKKFNQKGGGLQSTRFRCNTAWRIVKKVLNIRPASPAGDGVADGEQNTATR